MTITRHFVSVGDRQVHYRRAGDGPPVVLLHASPSSSWALTTFVETFGQNYAAIALDTPGYGLSDPLPVAAPEIGDYAEALADTLDALGIGRCALFGSHTGATIAIEFARRYPERVSVALFDGYPAWPDHERAEMEREYLPPWQPVWTGLHLVDFWLRYREMSIYWPWYDRRKSTRAAAGARDLDMLHRMTLAGFMAGAGYAKGYAAVFRYPEIEVVRDLQVPTCFAGRAEDSLNESLRQLGALPDCAWTETLPADDGAAARRYAEIIADHLPDESASAPPETTTAKGRISRRFVAWQDGEILVRETGDPDGRPLVILPHIPGSSESYEALMRAMARRRRVIAIDPPGNGDSDLDRVLSIDAQADAVREVLAALGIDRADIYGHGGGGTVAAALAQRSPDTVGKLILDGAVTPDADMRETLLPRYAAPIALEPEGGHLLKLWHALRNEQLYWPWYDESLSAVRDIEPDVEPVRLTTRLIGVLKQRANYADTWRTLLGDDLASRLSSIQGPTLVCAAENDPFAAFREASAKLVEGSDTSVVPIAAVDRAVPLRRFLDA